MSLGESVIDTDVHPLVKDLDSLFPYMPDEWVRYYKMRKASFPRGGVGGNPHGSVTREDARPPSGGPAGCDPEYVKSDYLDRQKVQAVILNDLNCSRAAIGWGNAESSVVLVRAFNDYYLDKWLPLDDRFKYALAVPSRDPQAAVEEIRKHGGKKGVVAVDLPAINVLMGNKYYYPIYEEALKYGLPIYVHILHMEGGPARVGGGPESYLESHNTYQCTAEANINSLIFRGVFERYPQLKVIWAEFGFAWALPLIWRFDFEWKALREETPWVKKLPSEYFHEHISLTTQPLFVEPQHLKSFVGQLGDDVLMFSSDYPHWDNDMPLEIMRYFPDTSKQRIMVDNASKVFKIS